MIEQNGVRAPLSDTSLGKVTKIRVREAVEGVICPDTEPHFPIAYPEDTRIRGGVVLLDTGWERESYEIDGRCEAIRTEREWIPSEAGDACATMRRAFYGIDPIINHLGSLHGTFFGVREAQKVIAHAIRQVEEPVGGEPRLVVRTDEG